MTAKTVRGPFRPQRALQPAAAIARLDDRPRNAEHAAQIGFAGDARFQPLQPRVLDRPSQRVAGHRTTGANNSAAAIRFIALFRPSLACSHGAAPGHAPHANR